MTVHSSLDFFPRTTPLAITFDPPRRNVGDPQADISATLTISTENSDHAVRFHLKSAAAAIEIGQRIIDAATEAFRFRDEVPPATPADVMPSVSADVEALLAADLPGLVDRLNERHF